MTNNDADILEIRYKMQLLEKRVDNLEERIWDKMDGVEKGINELKSEVREMMDKFVSIEKELVEKTVKYNGYENMFATKSELNALEDRIDKLEVKVESYIASTKSFEEGKNFIVEHWSEILGLILALLILIDKIRGG